ncbi:GNAT family N-acetyltransferase [Bacillus haikouensis]|uniref:GNAT family N-acetyltransferase n=1 Tax=Bacillus haikouensis TaxID=1510468 RepID=UPI001552A3FC|nr:GNAT family N-acetyltransferase [Bacillus haikouensis]NQD68823.1 GNAT family N-acetyltransferase [Bacillus haikouensis]
MKKYHIRKANPSDAHGIANVHMNSWKTTYKGIVSDRYLESLIIEDKRVRWDGILAGSHQTYVCELNNGDIAGFASIGKERDNLYEGELYAIYLLEEYQRNGLGSVLLKFAMDELKSQGHSNMLVWVLKENPSKHFYYSFDPVVVKEQNISIGGEDYKEDGLLFYL